MLLGDEAVDGAVCWKLQATPKLFKASQYTKSLVWIRKDNYAYARLDLYVGDEIVRRLKYSDIRSVQGIWTAREVTMTDLRRGSVTNLALDKIEYNVALDGTHFTLQGLRRQ